MNKIKLVAFDIDGTLVDDNKRFPDNFKEVIDYLLDNNIVIMICSGRSLKTLLRDFSEYKDKFYFVAENGAIVYYKEETTLISYLDNKIAIDIVNHLDKLKENDKELNYVVSCLDNAYIANDADKEFYNSLKPYYVINFIDKFEDINSKVIKIAAYAPSNSKERIKEKSLDFNSCCDVVVSGDEWCDFNPLGINKGVAVKNVLNKLNISKDEAAAFGDQNNDIDMLKEVKYSCAMKNATDDLKRVANYITDEDNNHNGALKYLLKILNI